MYRYTRTLESLLKNKNNHNVILDKKSNSGIVYKNNSFEVMDYNEICDKSFEKLDNHINSFFEEVINNDKYGLDIDFIKHNKKVHRRIKDNYMKYKPNVKDNKDKFEECERLHNVYNKVKDSTINTFNKIENEIKSSDII